MKTLYKYLLVTTFLTSFATAAMAAFLPIFFDSVGLSNVQIGIVLAVQHIITAILSIFVGYAEENINKLKILVTSYFGYSVLPLLYLGAYGFISIIVIKFYDGIVTAMRYVSKYSALETKKPYFTGINISFNDATANFGNVLGPLAAGVIFFYFGISPVFVMSAVILFLAALLSLSDLKYSSAPLRDKVAVKFSQLFKTSINNRQFILLSLVFLLFTAVDFSKFMAVTLYMDSLGFNLIMIGLVAGSFYFFTFIFELFSGRLEKKTVRNKMLFAGLVVSGLAALMFASEPGHMSYFIFLALLFSLGAALIKPAIFSDLVAIDNQHTNMETGIIFFFANIGATIGLLATGILTQLSFAAFFIFAGLALLAASLISLFYLKIR